MILFIEVGGVPVLMAFGKHEEYAASEHGA